MTKRLRLQISEYGLGTDLSAQIAAHSSISRTMANMLIQNAGRRAALNLGLDYNPIENVGTLTRVKDISGILQISPSIELEIVPKFLGGDTDTKWREDFFYLATLSRYGMLLNNDKISSSIGSSKNIATLIAKSYSNMYQENRRRPLRKYQRVKTFDFSLDGDIDPEEIIMPSSEGYLQESLTFNKVNNWNAVLQAAAFKLMSEISDPKVALNLSRMIKDFAGQPKPNLSRLNQIPSRQKIWKPVFELAVDILKDLSLEYNPGAATSPGFLIKTWQTWEDLLALSIKLGFKHSRVDSQKGHLLGSRKKVSAASIPLKVFPDCFIHTNGTIPEMIIDAKYKGNPARGGFRISESDIYESMAFSKATNCFNVILAYPDPHTMSNRNLGDCSIFEKIQVDKLTIYGLHISVRGISQKNGLQYFSKCLASNIPEIFK